MTSRYVDHTYDEHGKVTATEILEDGHITPANISQMRFEIGKGSDITANLDKRNAANPNPGVPQNTGRTGHVGVTIKYPDGETSSKAVLTQCVIQYRESMFKDSGRDYADTYVNLGIPKMYLDSLFSAARVNNVILHNKEKTREKSNYYWVDCDIRKLKYDDIHIIGKNPETGEPASYNKSIREMLGLLKQNIECTVTVSISGIMTNKDKTKELPLETGTYHPSIKLHEVVMIRESDIESPDLQEFATQVKNEKAAKTEAQMASSKILALALGRMNIGQPTH